MAQRIGFFLFSGLLLAGCGDGGGNDTTDAGSEDAPTALDAPAPPDAPPGTRDAGPFMVDPGTCDTWGIGALGAPITGLTDGTWTWVDFPEAHCMDGSSTGIGINRSPGGTQRLVIYLEGGGACFDALSCVGASNPNGFDATDFAASRGALAAYDLFSRTSVANELRDWSFVYVPYCSGDVHGGTNPTGFRGREMVGYQNVTAYLRRLVPTFPGLEQVLLTGSSAGGLGTIVNHDQVQQAFGCTPVHVLNDSGPLLGDEFLGVCLQNIARNLWRVPIPADCPQCTNPDGSGLSAIWGYLATKYPGDRFGFLSTTGDQTMRQFYGIGETTTCTFGAAMTIDRFTAGLDDFRDRILAPFPTQDHVFYVTSTNHTFLPTDYYVMASDGTSVAQFVRQLVTADPAWANHP